ncbi:venom metalloproteinase 1-like [Dermacentor silvarum]|uniref:venom metalloproteinase 1-like n=1 Tax=Dermacentor silvarum TaxID=543639 RepID=UPI0021013D22|nr:venom metalloproteinase 1-like [Dermacentor silvarum]
MKKAYLLHSIFSLSYFIVEPLESPAAFVAETCLIFENELVKRLLNEGRNIQEYAASFVASLNLILKQLKPPGMIDLTSLLINYAGPDDYLKYTKNNRVDGKTTVLRLVAYGWSSNEIPRADMTIVLIGQNMETVKSDGTWVPLYGITNTGGVCSPINIVLAMDTGEKYTGATSVAHEIGHLLGSPHDGEGTSKHCQPGAGYLMSAGAVGDIRPQYSQCSIEAISAFVTSRAQCLFEKNDPMPTTPERDSINTRPVAATENDAKYEKKRRKKCKTLLMKDEDLLQTEQMYGYPFTCTVLCTARSKSSNQIILYSVVAPNETPCDKRNTSKVCRRGRCK